MLERYRKDYEGEFVITKTVWKGGKKEQEREWIDNPIKVEQHSDRATCIAYSPSLKDTFYHRVAENRGGLLSKNKMQTYGIEEVWKHMKPNFLVSQTGERLQEIAETPYKEEVIVYTSAGNCIKYPGEFFLIPYNFAAHVNAQAAWLACFDGHKEVYLVGYDLIKDGIEQDKMINSVANVMDTYPHVQFIHVATGIMPPDAWRRRKNLKHMSLEDYISYCDV